jgi:DNA-binding transcriptional ArsR family regulator
MDDIFNVLAEPIRREILVRLRNAAPGDLSVGDLVTAVAQSQPTVSKHLKVLRDTGLVSVREEGQHRFYRLNPEPLASVEGWVLGMNDAPAANSTKSSSAAAAPSILANVDVEGIGRAIGRFAAMVIPPASRAGRHESR